MITGYDYDDLIGGMNGIELEPLFFPFQNKQKLNE